MYDHMHTMCMNAKVCACKRVCVYVSLCYGGINHGLSRGPVLLPPSVSVCRGEVFYTDDRVNGGR